MKVNLFSLLSAVLVPLLAFMGCAGRSGDRSLPVEEAYAGLVLPERPDSAQLAAAVQTARVWGFVKYHHPAFSSAARDADAEYFCLLNRMLQAPAAARNAVLSEWVASLGPFAVRDEDENDTPVEVFNDFAWITDTSLLGEPLSRTLSDLRRADPGRNRYVGQTSVNVRYIEPKYDSIPDEDVAWRLLGVAKFWNAVDSYSPNRNLTDRPWDEVLADYTAMAFDRSVEFSALYSRLVAELCDTHVNSWFIPLFGGRFVPLVCRFVEDRLFVTDTCTLVAHGLRIGDEILRIDSVRPIDRLAELMPYMPHSNRAALLRDGSYATLVTACGEARIEYRRGGMIRTAVLPAVDGEAFVGRIYASLFSPARPAFEKVADGIGLIRIGSLRCDDDRALGEFLNACDDLIIDLRAYPAEYDVIHKLLPKYFFSEAREAAEVLLPQAARPGTSTRRAVTTGRTSAPGKLFGGRTVLLVDARTQSMAEYFTMFLQTVPGVVTLGSRTAGADGNVTRIQLPYAAFNLTGLGVLYPDGRNAQRHGVKIDIVVEPTAGGMMRGGDEQLRAAVEYLQGKTNQFG